MIAVVRAIGAILFKPILAGWRWTAADPHRPFIVALAGLLVLHWLVLDPATESARDDAFAKLALANDMLTAERQAHFVTKENHRQAAAQAAALQAANLTRVASEQTAITDRISKRYEDDLAVLRTRRDDLAQQLRQATGTGASVPADLPLPASGEAAGPADAAPGADGLPLDACSPMNLDERFVASAQALQLNALIDWVEAQGTVEVDP